MIVNSIGGPQDVPATCEIEAATPLILSETMPQKIRYSYRVTWNVRVQPYLLTTLLYSIFTVIYRNRIHHGYAPFNLSKL